MTVQGGENKCDGNDDKRRETTSAMETTTKVGIEDVGGECH